MDTAPLRAELAKGVDWMETDNLLTGEGDTHARFRKAILNVFTPKRVREMEPTIREIIHQLVDRLAPRGECHLTSTSSFPVATGKAAPDHA